MNCKKITGCVEETTVMGSSGHDTKDNYIIYLYGQITFSANLSIFHSLTSLFCFCQLHCKMPGGFLGLLKNKKCYPTLLEILLENRQETHHTEKGQAAASAQQPLALIFSVMCRAKQWGFFTRRCLTGHIWGGFSFLAKN